MTAPSAPAPVEPTPVPPASTAASQPTLRLLAITPGHKPEAIIENAQTRRLYFVHQGEMADGLTAQRITDDEVLLHGEHGDITLSL